MGSLQITMFDLMEAVLDTMIVLGTMGVICYVLLVPAKTQHHVVHMLHLDHTKHHHKAA